MDKENLSPHSSALTAANIMASRRRSSILKLPKINLDDDDDQEKQSRKVRFSSNFVKPYTTEENTTIWDRTYEEPIQDSSSSKSHSEKSCNSNNSNTELINMFSDTSTGKLDISDFFDPRTVHMNKKQHLDTKNTNEGVRFASRRDKVYYEGNKENNRTAKIVPTFGVDEDLAKSAVNSLRSVQGKMNKTVFDQNEMEITGSVPNFTISEDLVGHALEFNQCGKRDNNKTVLGKNDMEFTEAVPNFSVKHDLERHAFNSHKTAKGNKNKTVLDENEMEFTKAAPNFIKAEDLGEQAFNSQEILSSNSNKTVLEQNEMDFTKAVPNFVIAEDLADNAFNSQTSMKRIINKTVLGENEMEFTEAVPNFVIAEDLAGKAFNSHTSMKRIINKTVLGENEMEFTEAVPNFVIAEDLAGNAFNPHTSMKRIINKTVLGENEMEFTEAVPNFVIAEDLAGNAFNSHNNMKRNINKTVLGENEMEFTEAVPNFVIAEDLASNAFNSHTSRKRIINKTVLGENEMEFTEAVPNFVIAEDLAGNAFSSCTSMKRNINKTVLGENEMEFTKAVTNFIIAEDLAGNAFYSHTSKKCNINKTVLGENEKEFTEVIPHFNIEDDLAGHALKTSETLKNYRNKTVLGEYEMELTKAIPIVAIAEDLAEHASNFSECEKMENEMEFTKAVPIFNIAEDLAGHAIKSNKSVKDNQDKTIVAENKMNFVEGSPSFALKEDLARHTLKQHENVKSNRNKTDLKEIIEHRAVIQNSDVMNQQKKLVSDENEKFNEIKKKNYETKPKLPAEYSENRELNKTSRSVMKNKQNVSYISSKSLSLQNRLIDDALSSGKKPTGADEPSYDDFQMHDFSNILADETSNVTSKLRILNSQCGSFNIFEDVSGVELLREVDDIDKKFALEDEKTRLESNHEFSVIIEPSFSKGDKSMCIEPLPLSICKNNTGVIDVEKSTGLEPLSFSSYKNVTEINSLPEIEISCNEISKRADVSSLEKNQFKQKLDLCKGELSKSNFSYNRTKVIEDNNYEKPQIQINSIVFEDADKNDELIKPSEKTPHVTKQFSNEKTTGIPEDCISFVPQIHKNVQHKNRTTAIETDEVDKCFVEEACENIVPKQKLIKAKKVPKSFLPSLEIVQSNNRTTPIKTNDASKSFVPDTVENIQPGHTKSIIELKKGSKSPVLELVKKIGSCTDDENSCVNTNLDELLSITKSAFEVVLSSFETDEGVSKNTEVLDGLKSYVSEVIYVERSIMATLDDLEMISK